MNEMGPVSTTGKSPAASARLGGGGGGRKVHFDEVNDNSKASGLSSLASAPVTGTITASAAAANRVDSSSSSTPMGAVSNKTDISSINNGGGLDSSSAAPANSNPTTAEQAATAAAAADAKLSSGVATPALNVSTTTTNVERKKNNGDEPWDAPYHKVNTTATPGPKTYISSHLGNHHQFIPVGAVFPGHPFPQQQPVSVINPAYARNYVAMADYQNTAPLPNALNFQPPVPDTQNGPMVHTYIPRHDAYSSGPSALPPGAPGTGFNVCAAQVSIPQHFQAPIAPVILMQATPQCSVVPFNQPIGLTPGNQPVFVAAQQPGIAIVNGQQVPMQSGQPYFVGTGQPTVMSTSGQPMMYATGAGQPPFGGGGPPIIIAGQPAPHPGGNMPPFMTAQLPPDITGVGRTTSETAAEQAKRAYQLEMFSPSDIKPADDDPSRFWWVRELDGNWTQRNRFTIDNLGDTRWYIADGGWMYAARMPT